MRMKNMILRTLLLIVFHGGAPLMAEDRILFRFDDPEAAKPWQTVNDGMSTGKRKVTM